MYNKIILITFFNLLFIIMEEVTSFNILFFVRVFFKKGLKLVVLFSICCNK